MNELIFTYNCLDGDYLLKASFDDKKIIYDVETSINELQNINGELLESNFIKLLDSACIEKWPPHVSDKPIIDDATKWKVTYIKDGITYSSDGEEGCWPYYYDNFIKAIKLIDSNADYFY